VICDGNGDVVWTATLLDAYGTVAIDDRYPMHKPQG
jgi:hypothetical protein